MKFLPWVIFGVVLVIVTPSQAASLSYFVPTQNGVAWKWFDASRKTTVGVHTFSEEPQALYWERDGSAVLALTGQNILAFDQHGVRNPGADIPAPSFSRNEMPVILWRDAETKRLRLATKYDVPEANVGGSPEAPVLTDAKGNEIKGLARPEWGLHVILNVCEFSRAKDQTSKGWQVIASVPTKMYAGDVPAFSVLEPYWNEDGYSDEQLSAFKHCYTDAARHRGRVCHLGRDHRTENAFLEMTYPQCVGKIRGCPIEAVGKVACEECLYDLFHATILVDQLNTAFPVYLRHRKTGKFTPLDDIVEKEISGKDRDFVMIGLSGHYVVMEPLRSDGDRHISVIDLMSGELVLHTPGEGAFWMPP